MKKAVTTYTYNQNKTMNWMLHMELYGTKPPLAPNFKQG